MYLWGASHIHSNMFIRCVLAIHLSYIAFYHTGVRPHTSRSKLHVAWGCVSGVLSLGGELRSHSDGSG